MILLLAGTAEARAVARALAQSGPPVLASLAGATREPEPLPVRTRHGGFGGTEGFREVLAQEGISKVLDATHPFAHRITDRTSEICRAMAVPYLQLLRPPWQPEDGDNWTPIDTPEDAAAIIDPGATVFLATGRQGLDRFAGLTGREVICRQIDPPDTPFPFPGGRYLTGRPPFTEAEETELFQALGIDWLVVKNAGGQSSRSKLDAARVLGIKVAMLARPRRPDAPMVETVAEAIAWART